MPISPQFQQMPKPDNKFLKLLADLVMPSNPVEGALDLAGPMMAAERVGGKVVKGLAGEILPMMKKSDVKKALKEYGSLRGIFDPSKGNLYVAPAEELTHFDIRQALEKSGLGIDGGGTALQIKNTKGKAIGDMYGKPFSENLRKNWGLDKFFDVEDPLDNFWP